MSAPAPGLYTCIWPPFSNILSTETDWPIKAKFYVEPPWEGGTKVCINGPGHMTKMAAMPIYGKNFKNLLLQNQKSYNLETWHVALGTQALQSLYKWWPWVDLGLFYGKVNFGHLYVWMGKTVIKSFYGGKLAAKDYIDWTILLMKNIWPQGVVCPCPGAIYLYMTTIFKHLLHWNRLANQSQILCGASLGRGNESLYKRSRSHDQDGRHAHIWYKPLKIFFSRTRSPIILKLGM